MFKARLTNRSFGQRVQSSLALVVASQSSLACGSLDYVVFEAAWSDTDASVVALRTVFPDAPNQDANAIRMELVLMPANDLGAEKILREFSIAQAVYGAFYMEERNYITVKGWSGDRGAGLIIDPDNPDEPTEVVPPDENLYLKAFLPSPDGALIAAVSLYDATDTRVDIYDVDAGEFVVSWTQLTAFNQDGHGGLGAKWSPAGDLYLPESASLSAMWLRFNGGLEDPVLVEPPPCIGSQVTTNGSVSAAGVGLCFDRHIETCEPLDPQGDVIPPFDCGDW